MIRPATDISPRDIFRTLFRHKAKVAAALVVCVLGTLAIRLIAPITYRSECKLLVRLGRENASVDPTVKVGESPVVAAPQPREDEINSIKQILMSRVLMEKLVDHFGPEALLEGMQI